MNQHSWNIFKRTTPTPEWFVHEFHFYLPPGPKKLGLDWPSSVHNTTWIELSWATKKRNSDTFHEIHVCFIFLDPYFMVYDEIIHTNNITPLQDFIISYPFFNRFGSTFLLHCSKIGWRSTHDRNLSTKTPIIGPIIGRLQGIHVQDCDTLASAGQVKNDFQVMTYLEDGLPGRT